MTFEELLRWVSAYTDVPAKRLFIVMDSYHSTVLVLMGRTPSVPVEEVGKTFEELGGSSRWSVLFRNVPENLWDAVLAAHQLGGREAIDQLMEKEWIYGQEGTEEKQQDR